MRADAPTLEKKLPASTALLAGELLDVDAIAAAQRCTRSEAIRYLTVSAIAARKDG